MIEFYQGLEAVLQSMGLFHEIEHMNHQIYKKRKPLDEYLKLIEKNGFNMLNVIHDEFKYQFVDGTTMFNHYFIKLAFLDGWMSIVPKELHKEVFSKVEARCNKIAEEQGSFTLSVPFVVIDCIKQ